MIDRMVLKKQKLDRINRIYRIKKWSLREKGQQSLDRINGIARMVLKKQKLDRINKIDRIS